MDEELLVEVKKKKALFKKLKDRKKAGLPSNQAWLEYKWQKMKTRRMQHWKRSIHIEKAVKDAGRDSQQLWRVAKNTLGWTKRDGIRQIDVGGEAVTNNEAIAGNFNDFFVEKIEKINEKIPQTPKDPLDYTRDYVSQFGDNIPEFNLQRVSNREIKKVINGLKNSNSTSYDDISTSAVKHLNWVITPWIKRIIILSFETNTFPEAWKTAKIVPIYKGSGQRSEMKSYRPVALLPCLSKVLEKVMTNQLTAHFEKFNELRGTGGVHKRLFSCRQHGYRAHMSCSTNILQLVDDILVDCMGNCESCLLMCDLSAAFDTVPHQVLLDKLALYGLSEATIAWFKSYLEGRKQYVDVNGGRSKTRRIPVGVFQGSIAGPILFIIFFNDLVTLQDALTKISIYADDNNYKLKLGNNVEENKRLINNKLLQVEEYMNANKLKFNVDKTQMMIMTPKKNKVNSTLTVNFNGHEIKPDSQAKFLGIHISDDLSWDNYIVHNEKSLLSFCNAKLGALKKLRRMCTKEQLLLLANGMVISKITYCISVWANVRKGLKQKVQDIITEMLRIVSGDYKSGVKELHENMRALSLDGWIQFMDVMSGRTCSDYIKPEDMAHKISTNNEDPFLPNTRGRAAGMITYTDLNTSSYTPRYSSYLPRYVRTYNKIPRDVTATNLVLSSASERHDMKKKVKDFIRLNQIYY